MFRTIRIPAVKRRKEPREILAECVKDVTTRAMPVIIYRAARVDSNSLTQGAGWARWG